MSLLKTQISFLKKGKLSSGEKVWPIFSRSIEHNKRQGTPYMAPESTLTNFVQLIISFFWDLRSR